MTQSAEMARNFILNGSEGVGVIIFSECDY
jgi:hypothetical protein